MGLKRLQAFFSKYSSVVCLGLLICCALVYVGLAIMLMRGDETAATYTRQYEPTPVPMWDGYRLYSPAPSLSPRPVSNQKDDSEGLLQGKYRWKFTDAEVLTNQSYSRKDVSISWEKYEDKTSFSNIIVYYVADILVDDVSLIQTVFAKGAFNTRGVKSMETIAKANRCVLAISGDYALYHSNGVIVRNGEVYRKSKCTSDLCVLYSDGVMETYEVGTITPDEVLAGDPWQSWHFGPELLDHNGQPKTKFNTSVGGRNPRAAIGYYEPGHYCFVIVDGRQRKYSQGLNMKELSLLMYDLGCVRAYNLDGGATARMFWKDKIINSPSKDRSLHDAICISFE